MLPPLGPHLAPVLPRPEPLHPSDMHGQIMNVLHGAMGHPHVSAPRKSSYAKILAILAADQASEHAGQAKQPSASPGGMGGVQQPQETGYPDQQQVALPYMNLPQHSAGYGPQGGFQAADGYENLLNTLRGLG